MMRMDWRPASWISYLGAIQLHLAHATFVAYHLHANNFKITSEQLLESVQREIQCYSHLLDEANDITRWSLNLHLVSTAVATQTAAAVELSAALELARQTYYLLAQVVSDVDGEAACRATALTSAHIRLCTGQH